MQQLKKTYSPYQFALWRICFGIYLVVYFIRILPFASELFSTKGIIINPAYNWTFGYFPNILNYFNSPDFITIFILGLILLSLCITLGVFRRTSALFTWYGWAALINFNNLTGDPSLPFIGLLLLGLSIIPIGEPLSLSRKKQKLQKSEWFMPAIFYWGMWLIFGVTFTISGLEKLASPSWQDGMAILFFYESAIALQWFLTDSLKLLPLWILKLKTWIVMYSQILAFPAIFFKPSRFLLWVVTAAAFSLSLLVIDLADVVTGMLLFYFFLFDSTWLDTGRRLFK